MAQQTAVQLSRHREHCSDRADRTSRRYSRDAGDGGKTTSADRRSPERAREQLQQQRRRLSRSKARLERGGARSDGAGGRGRSGSAPGRSLRTTTTAQRTRARADEQPAAPAEALMSAVRRAAAADDGIPALAAIATPRHARQPRPAVRRERADAQCRRCGAADAHPGRATRQRHGRALRPRPHAGGAQKRFAWRGMASDVEQYVLTCDACQRNKHSKQLTAGPADAAAAAGGAVRALDDGCSQRAAEDEARLRRHPGVRRSTHEAEALRCGAHLRRLGAAGEHHAAHHHRSAWHAEEHGQRPRPAHHCRFWRELSRLLGSEVNLSTAHHPQSDGQSEREIQTLITALRSYVNAMGNDWDEYLPALELAFNSKQQASTGAAPFTLVYGTEARLPIDCALDDARPATMPAVGERAERMKKALDHARSTGGAGAGQAEAARRSPPPSAAAQGRRPGAAVDGAAAAAQRHAQADRPLHRAIPRSWAASTTTQ